MVSVVLTDLWLVFPAMVAWTTPVLVLSVPVPPISVAKPVAVTAQSAAVPVPRFRYVTTPLGVPPDVDSCTPGEGVPLGTPPVGTTLVNGAWPAWAIVGDAEPFADAKWLESPPGTSGRPAALAKAPCGPPGRWSRSSTPPRSSDCDGVRTGVA